MFIRTTTGANRSFLMRRTTAGYPLNYWGQSSSSLASMTSSLWQMQSGRYHDAVSILTTDHREVVDLIDKLLHSLKTDVPTHEPITPQYGGSAARVRERGEEVLDNSGLSNMSPEEQQRALHEIIKLISVHSAVEEMHVYPQYILRLPDGMNLNQRSLDEHQHVKVILKDLDNFATRLSGEPKEWPEFPVETIEKLKSTLCAHIKEEEKHIFPLLKEFMKKGELEELGMVIVDAKSRVPTRPHPMAPNQPPLINVTGPLAAAMDKVRDKIRGVQEQTVSSNQNQTAPPQ